MKLSDIACAPGSRVWLCREAPVWAARIRSVFGDPVSTTTHSEVWENIAGFDRLEICGEEAWMTTQRSIVIPPSIRGKLMTIPGISYDFVEQVVTVAVGPLNANAATHKFIEDATTGHVAATARVQSNYVNVLKLPTWYKPGKAFG